MRDHDPNTAALGIAKKIILSNRPKEYADATPLEEFLEQIRTKEIAEFRAATAAWQAARESGDEDTLEAAAQRGHLAALAIHNWPIALHTGELIGYGMDTANYYGIVPIPRHAWSHLKLGEAPNTLFKGGFSLGAARPKGALGFWFIEPHQGFFEVRIAPVKLRKRRGRKPNELWDLIKPKVMEWMEANWPEASLADLEREIVRLAAHHKERPGERTVRRHAHRYHKAFQHRQSS